MPLLLAVAVSAGIAILAWALRALAPSGAIAAAGIGTAILWPTGWPGMAVLGVFFVGSTFVSRLANRTVGGSDQADTDVRDHRQVLANGGFAALGALTEWWSPGMGIWLATICLAASAADTWATALGSLSPRPPRDILTRQPVTRGTSGGVTWFGSSGGFMGAATVGLTGVSMGGPASVLLTSAVIGVVAMLVDSLLGSAVQARFRCPSCDQPTERRRHRCGTATELVRGTPWLDNDAVNALAGAVALLLAVAGWLMIAPGR